MADRQVRPALHARASLRTAPRRGVHARAGAPREILPLPRHVLMAKRRPPDPDDDADVIAWSPGVYTTAEFYASVRCDEERRETYQYPPSTSRCDPWRCATCHGAWTEAGSVER